MTDHWSSDNCFCRRLNTTMVCSDAERLITDQLTGLTRQKLIVVKLQQEGAVLLVSSTLTSQFLHGNRFLHSPSVPVRKHADPPKRHQAK